VIICIFGVELPEEIGLEGGRGRLVFEVCLDKGCLDLLVRNCDEEVGTSRRRSWWPQDTNQS